MATTKARPDHLYQRCEGVRIRLWSVDRPHFPNSNHGHHKAVSRRR
jgi:hypothetical protein